MIDKDVIQDTLRKIVKKELNLDVPIHIKSSIEENLLLLDISSDNLTPRIPFKMLNSLILKAKTFVRVNEDGSLASPVRMGLNYKMDLTGTDPHEIPAIYVVITPDGGIETDMAGTFESNCYKIGDL